MSGSEFPSISGDGKRIAFVSSSDLTGSNADGNFEYNLPVYPGAQEIMEMRYPRLLTRRVKQLAVLTLAVTSLINWVGVQAPALAPRPVRAQGGSKEAMVARMIELDTTITELKGQVAAYPKDKSLAARLADAILEYDSISARMGGDRAPLPEQPGGGNPRAPDAPAIAPPAPPGCTVTTTAFSNSTPVTIPMVPAVVSSTIVVAGIGASLFDLDLTTNITHTFAGDLDITLTSPAGTVVTITTDNGAENDNVFNGTVWDDSANPGGQVPYTANNGLVTDHTYADNTLASPLVPEEAMAAFVNENANGTWTLTISDDLLADGGALNSWALTISHLPVAPTLEGGGTLTNTAPVAIPSGPAVVSSTLTFPIPIGTSIHDVNLRTFILHTSNEDLDITLTSPAGTVVTITTDNGSSNDFVFNSTIWDDDANPGGQVPYTTNDGLATDHAYVNFIPATPLVPEEAMGAFIGENPNGTWTLRISDDLGGNGGSLERWSLTVVTATCQPCEITCPANVTQSNDPNQCGAVVNYAAPTTTGDCGKVTCAPASGSFFPVGTTTVTCTTTAGPTCTFTVTVNDTQPPTITCPANITVSGDPNQCGAVVNYPPPTVSDNCPGVGTPQCSPASGSFFPVGTTTVTCTAADGSGNTATCTFTVTLNDTQPPTITCQANQTGVTDQNACPSAPCLIVNFPPPVATDNCPGVTVVCNPPAGSCLPIGVTTVTCTATDASGNTATCSFTVSIFDVALQDDSNPGTILLWNSITGSYRFCCNGIPFTGVGKSRVQGCVYTLEHNPVDRRLLGRVDKAVHAGSGSIQAPAGTIRCTITDRSTLNDTNLTSCQ